MKKTTTTKKTSDAEDVESQRSSMSLDSLPHPQPSVALLWAF